MALPLSRTMFRKAVCLWNQNWQVELICCVTFPLQLSLCRLPPGSLVNWHKDAWQRPLGPRGNAVSPSGSLLFLLPLAPASHHLGKRGPHSLCVFYNPGWTYHQILRGPRCVVVCRLPHGVNLNPSGREAGVWWRCLADWWAEPPLSSSCISK